MPQCSIEFNSAAYSPHCLGHPALLLLWCASASFPDQLPWQEMVEADNAQQGFRIDVCCTSVRAASQDPRLLLHSSCPPGFKCIICTPDVILFTICCICHFPLFQLAGHIGHGLNGCLHCYTTVPNREHCMLHVHFCSTLD